MDRILIADSLEPSGLEILKSAGAEVTLLADADRPRLAEILPAYDALVVRSMTKVTRALIAAGTKLRVIGRAGIGVDNIDVPAATEHGILVVNAPTANLMSACEHTFALLFSLARAVPAADATMKAGQWNRKPFVGFELDGKTLGLIGFGRIGQRVAERAKAFGMTVIAYDPMLDAAAARALGVEPVTLDELIPRCDVLSFHTPLNDSNRGLLSAERLATMKKGALVVNCARGGLIDEPALVAALDAGHLGGAALDVYEEEPPTYWPLAQHPKVVATPHIGAQTKEAQERIAIETSRMVLAALAGDPNVAAVNVLPAALAR
ncbi:MAG: hydroxyacid dehydrogenase [Thermoanaerobaculia bacterium]|nr:hydroxyacid dehydrogenase [Thermoanaerobaculia bacterium]